MKTVWLAVLLGLLALPLSGCHWHQGYGRYQYQEHHRYGSPRDGHYRYRQHYYGHHGYSPRYND